MAPEKIYKKYLKKYIYIHRYVCKCPRNFFVGFNHLVSSHSIRSESAYTCQYI